MINLCPLGYWFDVNNLCPNVKYHDRNVSDIKTIKFLHKDNVQSDIGTI